MTNKITTQLFILLALITSAHAASPLADPATPTLKGYTTEFSDEFNQPELNKKKWNLGINARNAVLASNETTYTMDNLILKDGHLSLQARKIKKPIRATIYGGKTSLFHYTSGAINTDKLYNLTGEFYIEIRCQLPQNPGGFCAFWTMASQQSDLSAIYHHETDFFEFKCNPIQATGYQYFSSLWWHELTAKEAIKLDPATLKKKSPDRFWITQQKDKPHYQPTEGRVTHIDFTKPFTMGLKATHKQLTWHITQNGSAYHTSPYMTYKEQTVTSRHKSNPPSLQVTRPVPRFNNYLVLNYHLRNAKWVGGPIDSNALPADMKIDYIRVYQKKQPTPKP